MSDISKDINFNIISFADDTRLYSAINSPADCDSLQCDLSNLCGWILRTFENRSELLMLTLFKPCVPNDDNSLDARIHEMRWCTPRGGLAN